MFVKFGRKIFKTLPIIIAVGTLIFMVTFSHLNRVVEKDKKQNNLIEEKPIVPRETVPKGEMRAVWVPFTSLDMSGDKQKNKESFKERFDKIIKESKSHHINTLVVHVRSHSDAMYKSKIFPWSHLLTGEQGKDPGYDPLDYMVKAAHENEMKIHAWINPFRVQSGKIPGSLSNNNPSVKWEKDSDENSNLNVIDWRGEKFYNPASSEVRKLIIQGAKEIAENYEIDGLHLDDYFYPTEKKEFDEASYGKYLKTVQQTSSPLNLSEFRKANINSVVSGIYSSIKSINKDIQLGISPRCNIEYDLSVGADVILWGSKKGYVDYLCPQVYVNFEHPTFPFDKTSNKWREIVKGEDVKLYLGLGVYKAGSPVDNGTWKRKNDILTNQVEYGRKINCDGFMLFSFDSLIDKRTQPEVANVMKVFN
ncbi:MAG: family 10 glycosylhydrolase [Oscillospiraceae bacterium]|nr:family 10 glycosylhydrolase [Oscillospiraceae bacterium]